MPLKKLLMKGTVLQSVAQFVILPFFTGLNRVSSMISPAPSGVKASVGIHGALCFFSIASISSHDGACQSIAMPSMLSANSVLPSGEKPM